MRPLVTLSSDFGKQTHGCGIMESVVSEINPEAEVVHLEHGIPDYDIMEAARLMETVRCIRKGIHVCVVDPGVGTRRRAIAIRSKRGDIFIGPDNGVLIPGARILGGVVKAVELSNEKYMKQPVSDIFHGRDIFSPAAGYLSKGAKLEEFGDIVEDPYPAPYEEAVVKDGSIEAMVISINKFGSVHLNVLHEEWEKLGLSEGSLVNIDIEGKNFKVPYHRTFGAVDKGEALILKDDYYRVEIAINLGNFSEKFGVKRGSKVKISV